MRPVIRALLALLLLGAAHGPLLAGTWHVDAVRGDDGNSGATPDQALRSLARLAGAPVMPGDSVLLAAGSVWTEPLLITRSGREGAPIVYGRYGEGVRPRIDAGGIAENAVTIRNAEYVTLSGLEITNQSATTAIRRGVHVIARDAGVVRGIIVRDLYIHDVTGTNGRKDNGGIVFEVAATRIPTRFEGVTIERNLIWRVDRSGVAGISDQISRARWFPSRFVVIRDNVVEDVGGDGIVVRGTDGALIEHNIVRHAAARANAYSAGIWQWSTDNTLIQLNEAAFTHGLLDGQGFDSDFNSRRTVIAHNFSHDNEGGFLLLCTPVQRNDAENLGNIGTVARHNVSRNDRTRIFQLGGASDALIANNVVHVGEGDDVQMVIATQWLGWSRDIMFRHNRLIARGTARYGHEVGRDGGRYLLGAGFAPARGIRFESNGFIGRHVDPPEDRTGVVEPEVDDDDPNLWAVPVLDPKQPEMMADFIPRHRDWMMRMLTRELGFRPRLAAPKLMYPAESRRP